MTSSLFKRTLTLMSVVLLSGVALTACNKAADGGNETGNTSSTAPAAGDATTPATPEGDTGAAMEVAPVAPQEAAPVVPQELPQDTQAAPSDMGSEPAPEMPVAPEQQQQQ